MMNQMKKYLWLVETIHNASRISYREISDKWAEDHLCDPLPERTFHTWRIACEEIFGFNIINEKKDNYRYFIENYDEVINGNSFKSVFLNNLAVNDLLLDHWKLRDRILLESVPSGEKHLSPILDAMNTNRMIAFKYNDYWKDTLEYLEVEPYCIKLAKQRWYVLAHCPQTGVTKAYPIDRISELKTLKKKTFKMPEGFSAEEFFRDFFGATAPDSNTKTEHVKLQVGGNQVKYFRSLPKHQSQKETFICDSYSIFEYDVKPTYDFQQVILSHAPDVLVLEPQSLRDEIKWKIEEMIKRYESK